MMTQKIKITPNGNATRIDMDNCVQPFLWGKFPNGTPTKSRLLPKIRLALEYFPAYLRLN